MDDKEVLKERIRQCVAPDDKIAVLFLQIKGEKFLLDIQKIHSAVKQLKGRFPLFDEFVFTRNDVYPYSPLLEKVIFRLIQCDLIQYLSDMKTGIISAESKKWIRENVFPLFERKEQKKLIEAGKLFVQLIQN